MPQFSPIWFINTISWTFVLLNFIIYYVQIISFPNLISLQLSRNILS